MCARKNDARLSREAGRKAICVENRNVMGMEREGPVLPGEI
jgi:hypothetical protein